MATQESFRFKKFDNVGVADAEDDGDFLKDCFVDKGDLEMLLAPSDHRRLILGRTGSGKTALITRLLETGHRVIQVPPEDLALNYISNSTTLQFIEKLGVKLDVFYRLLWRHVFTVELIKAHRQIDDEASRLAFVQWFKDRISDKKQRRALEYLQKWGDSFWEETQERIKEITTRIETEVQDAIKVSVPHISFDAKDIDKLSVEQKVEILHQSQQVVNNIQVQQLSTIIEMLDNLLDDPQKRYFILIDRLDEDWIEDRLRHLLIRGLIDTVREFRKVRQAKIVVCLRYDLIDRVFRLTRDPGFQEEKYEAMYLELGWTREQLIDLLDARVNHMVRRRYTKQRVFARDLLPRTSSKPDVSLDFILERTLMRPRDVIDFFNRCIAQAADNPKITPQMLKQAELEYSQYRLRSLVDEWFADYPNLQKFVTILKERPTTFALDEITDEETEEFCLSVLSHNIEKQDALTGAANQVFDGNLTEVDFRKSLILIFYKIGIVGLKLQNFESVTWTYKGRRTVQPEELKPNVRVSIHPCLWRVLGIRESKSRKAA